MVAKKKKKKKNWLWILHPNACKRNTDRHECLFKIQLQPPALFSHNLTVLSLGPYAACVSVCIRERAHTCVSEREIACVCVCVLETVHACMRERNCMLVRVCVCACIHMHRLQNPPHFNYCPAALCASLIWK